MFLADYHSHTHNSPDGKPEANALSMGKAAIDAGLAELCITEHYECNGFFMSETENIGITYDKECCRRELAEARAELEGQIVLPWGIEIGQATQVPDAAARVLAEEDYDFIIGSLHNIRGLPDFCFVKYQSEEHCMQLLSDYLSELLEMVNTARFDVLGHVDYPLRYMRRRFDVSFHPLEEELRQLLRQAARRGRGIELNAKVLRGDNPINTQQDYLLRIWREEGGEILTAGSDAHCPADVGAGIRESYALARENGFGYVATFREHKPEFHKI